MGMSIDEYIKRMGDIRRNYNRWGEILTPNEVKAFNMTMDIVRKYEKITEIVKSWRENGLDYDSCDAMENIERVIEE